jgi:hypothetical protein
MPDKPPVALVASEAPPRAEVTSYPDHLAKVFSKRTKHPLGDLFGLRNFVQSTIRRDVSPEQV